jgi:hypothetical protein
MEHGGTQEKVMITCDDDQVLSLEKRKEKNKNLRRSRKRYKIDFYFALKTP